MRIARTLPLLACLLAILPVAALTWSFLPPVEEPEIRGHAEFLHLPETRVLPLNPAQQPTVVRPDVIDIDLRQLPRALRWSPGDAIAPGPQHRGFEQSASPSFDPQRPGIPGPLLSRGPSNAASGRQSLIEQPSLSFDGQPFTGVLVPDTVGEAGFNHYIQMVNSPLGSQVTIYDKRTGNVLAGPILLDALAAPGTACTIGFGDPLVVFDHLANRWLLTEFTAPGLNTLCVYVSRTADPIAGGWYVYNFPAPFFPDYPKYAVWPTAYFASSTEFPGETPPATPAVYALDRARMLVGQPAAMIRFIVPPLAAFYHQGLTPADLDGPILPPAGAPGLFLRHVDDEAHYANPDPQRDFLELWEMRPDFVQPALSTLTGPMFIPTADFESELCGLQGGACFPQMFGLQALDPLREYIMWRLQYRNQGDHQTLVGNFTVDAAGGAANQGGIRWFELRQANQGGGPWQLHQEGTHAPDGDSRWLGSAAMDRAGDIALGFSHTGQDSLPGIRYAGRHANDPPGAMPEGEFVLQNSGLPWVNNRWGDYSAISVDPSDDCTFWYTNEYIPGGAFFGWRTKISRFKFDTVACATPADLFITGEARRFPANLAEGDLLYVQAEGTVKLSAGGNDIGPDGNLDSGDMNPVNLGFPVQQAGTSGALIYQWEYTSGETTSWRVLGTLRALQVPPTFPIRYIRFAVNDNYLPDNEGGFQVRMLAPQQTTRTFCIEGNSTGAGWTWGFGPTMGIPETLPAGAPASDFVNRFVGQISFAWGGVPDRPYVSSFTPTCFDVSFGAPFELHVGPAATNFPNQLTFPTCEVLDRDIATCAFNPIIYELSPAERAGKWLYSGPGVRLNGATGAVVGGANLLSGGIASHQGKLWTTIAGPDRNLRSVDFSTSPCTGTTTVHGQTTYGGQPAFVAALASLGGKLMAGFVLSGVNPPWRLGEIDANTAITNAVDYSPFGARFSSLTVSPAGQLYSLDRINPGTSRLYVVGVSPPSYQPIGPVLNIGLDGIEFANDGSLFGIASNQDTLYEIDPNTGQVGRSVKYSHRPASSTAAIAALEPPLPDADADGVTDACECTGSSEVCNGIDDDCNGIVDDGFNAIMELCNGIDDDCDGLIDEAGVPAVEQCNGRDDDCDGLVDEGDPGGGGSCSTSAPGVCSEGTVHCVGGALMCRAARWAGPELCANGLDDDCDGMTDESAGDADHDGVNDCSDNCPDTFNPPSDCDLLPGTPDDQCDADSDGEGDPCDLPAPPPPINLRLGPATAALSWDATPGAAAYNLYRGSFPATGPFAYNHECLQSDIPLPAASDGGGPSSGGVYYYLVTARAAQARAESGLGQDSLGALRPRPSPCPPPGTDLDGDAISDAGDTCPSLANPGQGDWDNDGRGDICDNCVAVPNPNQVNRDKDDRGDACDDCPANSIKPLPGICGCDMPDVDSDGDGPLDCQEECPNDPAKTGAGLCGCGIPDMDTDGDGQADCVDPDDDNDGVTDASDPSDLDPSICGDTDADTCDDCAVGTDDFGPLPDSNPANDGPDADSDGICDAGDTYTASPLLPAGAVLYVDMNGSDGAADFIDLSDRHTVACFNQAAKDTGETRFDTAAFRSDAPAPDYLELQESTGDFKFLCTAHWTLSMWVRLESATFAPPSALPPILPPSTSRSGSTAQGS